MDSVWEVVKAAAGIVGQAAVETGMKGKLQADLLLISHEIENRKRAFGEELYEYVVRKCEIALLFSSGSLAIRFIESCTNRDGHAHSGK